MSDNSGNDGTARIMLILFNRKKIYWFELWIYSRKQKLFFFLSKMNHYLYMKRECLLFWFSIERQIVWLQPFFIISLAIYKMKFYPHARQMHWWMSPYELHFILFTLQAATWSLYFVFNSPIMFSLSFDCWQHAMLLQMFHFGRVSLYLGSRVHISKAYLPRKDWSFKLQKMGVL